MTIIIIHNIFQIIFKTKKFFSPRQKQKVQFTNNKFDNIFLMSLL